MKYKIFLKIKACPSKKKIERENIKTINIFLNY